MMAVDDDRPILVLAESRQRRRNLLQRNVRGVGDPRQVALLRGSDIKQQEVVACFAQALHVARGDLPPVDERRSVRHAALVELFGRRRAAHADDPIGAAGGLTAGDALPGGAGDSVAPDGADPLRGVAAGGVIQIHGSDALNVSSGRGEGTRA